MSEKFKNKSEIYQSLFKEKYPNGCAHSASWEKMAPIYEEADEIWEEQILNDANLKDFVDHCKKTVEKVKQLENEAQKLIRKIENVLSESGLSYYCAVSPISQTFSGSDSEEFSKRFVPEGYDLDDILEICEFFHLGYINEYGKGWEHSQVC